MTLAVRRFEPEETRVGGAGELSTAPSLAGRARVPAAAQTEADPSATTETIDLLDRARLYWPRLEPPRDPAVRHDPARMAAYVARRTALPPDAIRTLLEIA